MQKINVLKQKNQCRIQQQNPNIQKYISKKLVSYQMNTNVTYLVLAYKTHVQYWFAIHSYHYTIAIFLDWCDICVHMYMYTMYHQYWMILIWNKYKWEIWNEYTWLRANDCINSGRSWCSDEKDWASNYLRLQKEAWWARNQSKNFKYFI